MRRLLVMITVFTILAVFSSLLVWASEPVKWSAPMNEYPTQWVPAPQPPSYYNMYGYRYPYAAYGGYDVYGYGTFGRYYGGYPGYAQGRQGYYGYPYGYSYGGQ